jgi:hypothetical protein
MNTIKSILSVSFLLALGIVIGQTSVGKTLYNTTISWIMNNPVNSTVKQTFENAKDKTQKVQKKIQVKYKEIKEEIKKENTKTEDLILPRKYKDMEIVQSTVKGKSIFIVADKDGFRCEYLQSPHSKYSRCYQK